MTGAILAAIALVSLLIGKGVFGVIAGAVVLLAQGELYGVMVKHHRQPATAVGLVDRRARCWPAPTSRARRRARDVRAGRRGHVPVVHGRARRCTRKDTAVNIGLTILNLAWIPLLGRLPVHHAGRVERHRPRRGRDRPDVRLRHGRVPVRVGVGRQFFQRPLAPSVSPKKSIEGVIVGTARHDPRLRHLVSAFVDLVPGQADRNAAPRPGGGRRGNVRRPRGVAREARPGHQGHERRCCRATAACSTGSTRSCSWRRPRSCFFRIIFV